MQVWSSGWHLVHRLPEPRKTCHCRNERQDSPSVEGSGRITAGLSWPQVRPLNLSEVLKLISYLSQSCVHVFRAAIDCIGMINEEHFVSGSQDGYVADSMIVPPSIYLFLFPYTRSRLFSLTLFQVLSLNYTLHRIPHISFLLSSIALWSFTKKKPLVVKPHHAASMTSSVPEEHWVTAVAAYPNTDLVASGTCIHYSTINF